MRRAPVVASCLIVALACGVASATPGDVAWSATEQGSASEGWDIGRDLALSPAGDAMFVAGLVENAASQEDGFVARYDPTTGQQLWRKVFDGAAHKSDWFVDLEPSPDGNTVYALGQTEGDRSTHDALVVAYASASGKRLWVARYSGPKKSDESSESLAVDPSGKRVYICGWGSNVGAFVTAFGASGGPPLWTWKGTGYQWLFDVAAASGGRVLAAGKNGGDAFVGVFKGKTGAKLWSVRRAGSAGDTMDRFEQVVIGPSGTDAYAIGTLENGAAGADAILVKMDLANGSVPWSVVHDTGGGAEDEGNGVAVAADGTTVYSMESHYLYPTSSYDISSYATGDGAKGWTSSGPNTAMLSLAVGSDGHLYTRGEKTYSYGVARYSPDTGVQSWSISYPAATGGSAGLAVSPDATHVFVTGDANYDATTVSLATS